MGRCSVHRPCGECIGVVQLASDWGINLTAKSTWTHPQQFLENAHGHGNEKLIHVPVGTLWIQELVDKEEVTIHKVLEANNVADILTKNIPSYLLGKHATAMSFFFLGGRAEG